ncbi:MAG: ABC transporter substrate-binding protein [Clostridia bacterium]|nr:ABC transporter substrate-binding protein [Clostridia bacterium]
MKKLISLLLALTLCLLSLSAAFADAEAGKAYKAGIIMLIENGAFLDMKTGIIQGLAGLGYVEGENLTIDYQCAQGDATNLQTICQNMADSDYDVVFTIATPPTQAFVGLESAIPNVFCSVAAPVVAGVMSDLDTPDMNATGTSNAIPSGDIISMGLQITPDVKTFGLIYATSEVNAVNAMNTAKSWLDANGYAYVEKTVANSGEVQTATQAVLDQGADVLFIANDSVVQAAVDILAELATEEGVPTYCCSATTVQSGCLATLAMSDIYIGEETAKIADLVLNGTPVAEIPAEVVPANIVSINQDTLAALGLEVPASLSELGEVQYLTAN